ncbi:MarR family transcriptional regulator [candidate division GN15 bacterium]|nr:MarR family transcriptional regulator [candidate division GN15 bacterium]
MADTSLDLQNSLGRLVGRTSRALQNRLNHNLEADGYSVTAEQWIIIVNLWHHEGRCQQWLADIIGKDKTSITRQLDTMARHGLIKRVPGTEDRRQNMVYLTDKGRALREDLTVVVKRTLAEAEAGIDPDELLICKEVLKKIWENVEHTPGGAATGRRGG